MSPLPPGFDPNNPACPGCGGAMYDNRQKKADGSYTSKRADFSCMDKKGCDKGLWIEAKGARPAKVQGATVLARPTYSPAQKKLGRDALLENYMGLMRLVTERMVKMAGDCTLPVDMANVQAATYSIFGLMDKAGYLPVPSGLAAGAAPSAPQAPAPPPPAPAPRSAPPARPAAPPARGRAPIPGDDPYADTPDVDEPDELPF